MTALEYLQDRISENDSLAEIVDVFEAMCKEIPIEADMLLFETGTFDFSGEPLFYFSMVRQFPDAEEEYFQIHADVLYKACDANSAFSDTVWNDELDGDFFDYIRKLPVYQCVRHEKYLRVHLSVEET